jgi:hypothetical protein
MLLWATDMGLGGQFVADFSIKRFRFRAGDMVLWSPAAAVGNFRSVLAMGS